MSQGMDDPDFDRALIASAFDLAAAGGWSSVSVAAAAQAAGLALDRARGRFPGRTAILLRFGRHADQAALAGAPAADSSARDRLFDLLMRRIDALQAHRAGMIALLRALPADPPTALLLAALSRRSMGWMLEAAGVSARGLRGAVRTKGLLAVWLWTLRAWMADETADLAATMAALDTALSRADQAASWLDGPPPPPPAAPPAPPPEPPPEPADLT